MKWLSDGAHERFNEQYARAKEQQADLLFDECLEIADDDSDDVKMITRQDGSETETLNAEFVQRSKLRIDTRKWMAGKLAPKKYGEKLQTELSGPGGDPIQISSVERIIVRADRPPQIAYNRLALDGPADSDG